MSRIVQAAPIVLVLGLILAGCESAGISATDDPNVKLAQAETLRAEAGRIMQARRMTEQAIALFEQRSDKAGLARAYREYGLVALDGGLGDNPVIQRQPESARHPRPGDLDSAEANLKRALDLATETSQLYIAANVNFLLGNVEVMRGKPEIACPFYDLSIKGFRDAKTRQPGTTLDLPAGLDDPTTILGRAKKEAGCASA